MRKTVLAAAAAIGAAAAACAAEPLRLCADPANLPFSTSSEAAAQAGTPGLYVEIGAAVAEALGRPMQTVWSLTYFGKRNLGTTLLAGQCDFAVGLPADDGFMGPRVIFSRPIATLGFALAVHPEAPVTGLADLDGKRVAVQFASPPQSLVATREAIQAATVMDPEEGMRLLADGRVDAAFVWGPSAGYDNHARLHDAFRVVPVDAPQMQFPTAIGFARKDRALRDEVDAALPALAPRIAALFGKYAVPAGPAVKLAAADAPPLPAPAPAPAAKPGVKFASVDATQPAPAPARGQMADAAAGQVLFNGTCAHCHGPDAIQSERKINLRLLRHRYGDGMQTMFMTTVEHGRPTKGMPNWSGVFSQDDFARIYAFLSTVQDP